jgi:TIR domain
MNPSISSPIPEIYILWHPRCELGEFLARRIHGWLRPGNGLGPQVFYRSLPAPEAPVGGLPPPLPGEWRSNLPVSTAPRVSNLQIVLPLIDEHMIADAAWRQWLAQLTSASKTPEPRDFMPIALDSTAFNAPEQLRQKNFLRPVGLSVTSPVDETAKEAVARSLLKQLTEAMCWLMLGKGANPATPMPTNPPGTTERDAAEPKLKIFLSHAKTDGTVPARRIRDYIYSQTQLAAFYDENDIPFGSVFRRVLERDVQSGETAALIVVRSARYASRPWCRRELSLFRRPIPETPDPTLAVRWRLSPVVVVEAIEGGGRTTGIPELGNASLIRWADTVPDQEEQIVSALLRDAMLAAFHSAVGRTLPEGPDRIILNWLPDPTTLLHIPRVRDTSELKVFYPGRGLSGLELDILFEFFPNIEFRSFEEILS